jgi:hypothetical protein
MDKGVNEVSVTDKIKESDKNMDNWKIIYLKS